MHQPNRTGGHHNRAPATEVAWSPPSDVLDLRYLTGVAFEAALERGDLDVARAELDELARLPETGGLHMPECYADLARAFDHRGRHDDAITAMERAIEHGWDGVPDGRSDIAEFHLRAGRHDEAAAIWAQLRAEQPGDVWLYNAAGLSYAEIGEHELAVDWLAAGIELAIGDGDPEGIVAQLSDLRRRSLEALGRDLDDLERRADDFLDDWRARRHRSPGVLSDALERPPPDLALALAWFPAGEYEAAVARWPSLAEDWADVPHADYCQRMDGHIKWMRRHGVMVRAVAPIVVDDFVAWCDKEGEDPEHARASYAAEVLHLGRALDWPPGRNEQCWCSSQRKYKKCCGRADAAPMHDVDE